MVACQRIFLGKIHKLNLNMEFTIKKRQVRLTTTTLIATRLIQELMNFLWEPKKGPVIKHLNLEFTDSQTVDGGKRISVACELMTAEGFKFKISYFTLLKSKGSKDWLVWMSQDMRVEIVHDHKRSSRMRLDYTPKGFSKNNEPEFRLTLGADELFTLRGWIESRRREAKEA